MVLGVRISILHPVTFCHGDLSKTTTTIIIIIIIIIMAQGIWGR
jgi:tRNA A-37 threonylcarbamoyl transferase component Bud32